MKTRRDRTIQAPLDPSVRASNDRRAWRRPITARHAKKAPPFCLLLHQSGISGPKGREGAMAPLGTNDDTETTNDSRELLSETAPMEKHPAPLSARDMFARLAGIGVLLLGVVGAFLYLGGWCSPQKLTPAR